MFLLQSLYFFWLFKIAKHTKLKTLTKSLHANISETKSNFSFPKSQILYNTSVAYSITLACFVSAISSLPTLQLRCQRFQGFLQHTHTHTSIRYNNSNWIKAIIKELHHKFNFILTRAKMPLPSDLKTQACRNVTSAAAYWHIILCTIV